MTGDEESGQAMPNETTQIGVRIQELVSLSSPGEKAIVDQFVLTKQVSATTNGST